MRHAYKVLVGQTQGKRPIGEPKYRSEYNKINLRGKGLNEPSGSQKSAAPIGKRGGSLKEALHFDTRHQGQSEIGADSDDTARGSAARTRHTPECESMYPQSML
jgi:hypothetical protein